VKPLDRRQFLGAAAAGDAVRSARATTVAVRDVHDANTIDSPGVGVPQQPHAVAPAQPLVFRFPPASVTRLDIALGG
jgi:hypothetical protein